MALLFILFLIPNFVLANEKTNNYYIEKKDFTKISLEKKNNINDLLQSEITLKDIPQTKISEKEKKSLRERNPFLPIGSNNLDPQSRITFSDLSFKGIAKIGNTQVVFIETTKGTNAYEIGQDIGAGFTLSSIDDNKLLIEITNQSITHSIKLEKDEK